MTLQQTEQRFTTWTTWDGYLRLRDVMENHSVRITYDRGAVEFLSPSKRHERLKALIGDLLKLLMDSRDVDFESGGSTTFRSQLIDRGLEPDDCYWIANVAAALGDDQDEEPRPDLAMEIEVSRSAIDRLPIYAALGVPELWRWVDEGPGRLEFRVLVQPNRYDVSSHSRIFPDLAADVFESFIRTGRAKGRRHTMGELKSWLVKK